MVEGVGFEPTKAEPSDLQSDPFDRSGTPPNSGKKCQTEKKVYCATKHSFDKALAIRLVNKFNV